ncbi:hypothetical protein I5W42_18580 [Stenotrophomonas maltophilia]|nr:hypothetical protein [Stenotrophomonas maltophilia]
MNNNFGSLMSRITSDGFGANEAGRVPASSVGYPFDTSSAVLKLFAEYAIEGQPVAVSFRQLVPWIKMGERATHHIHHYPAKLIPQIAHFFLATEIFCPRYGVVLDPFGGTGTVALETCLSGRHAVYADTNPLARMIAAAKVTPIANLDAESLLSSVYSRYKRARSNSLPDVVNVEKWFAGSVIRQLARLKRSIDAEPVEAIRNFLLVTFSATLRKVSNADPRLSVPVLIKARSTPSGEVDVFKRFSEQCEANVRRMSEYMAAIIGGGSLTIAGSDCRRLLVQDGGVLNPGEVDLVISSPPYAGAQKYIRASSLSLGWLGLAGAGKLKPLENLTIGREHLQLRDRLQAGETHAPSAEKVLRRIEAKNGYRAAICRIYLIEMYDALVQAAKCLRLGGYFILIIGNNQVCGEEFWSSTYLSEMLTGLGFRVELELVDEIKSRGLMTKRNRSAGMISREWVIVFKKVRDA